LSEQLQCQSEYVIHGGALVSASIFLVWSKCALKMLTQITSQRRYENSDSEKVEV